MNDDQSLEGLMNDLPRVLLENYVMLAAAIENQNLGRLQDMLQYQQKVHHNLVSLVQHIEDAPAVAMTTTSRQEEQQQQEHRQPESLAAHGPAYDDDDGGAAAAGQQQHGFDQQPASYQLHQGPQMPQQQQTQQQQQQQQLHAPCLGLQPPQQQQRQPAPPGWLANVNQPVHDLLQGLGLLEFKPLLEQQHVDLAALQLMEERHLRELGLPIGAVVKIKAALATQQW